MPSPSRRHFLRTSAAAVSAASFALSSPAPTNPYLAEKGNFASKLWPSTPPAGCPLPPSSALTGVRFLGRFARYAHADTWYPSWASDNNLYSPWTDGEVGDVKSMSFGPDARTGQAKISGDDPLNLTFSNLRTNRADPAPYGGRYPCGSLVYNGVWYYGTYCLIDTKEGLNWDVLGPFVGFQFSTDFGNTWRPAPHTPSYPLFHEPKHPGKTVRFGVPHFVDFGCNLQHSPDGKAYLVAHGSAQQDPVPRQANASWITGDQIYLARVTPSVANISNASKYEFFGGHKSSGKPLWTTNFKNMKPLIDWNNNCGNVTATYISALKKYVMCITDGQNTISRFNTYVLESDLLTGPWKLITYMKNFGEQAYFVNIRPRKIQSVN